MFRYLLLIFIILGAILIVVSFIFRTFRNLFSPFQRASKKNVKKEADEVVYQNDKVVVLKGEAGKKKQGIKDFE